MKPPWSQIILVVQAWCLQFQGRLHPTEVSQMLVRKSRPGSISNWILYNFTVHAFAAPVPKPGQPADNVDCPLHLCFCSSHVWSCKFLWDKRHVCGSKQIPLVCAFGYTVKKKRLTLSLHQLSATFFFFNRLSVHPASGSMTICAKVCNFLKLLGFPTSLKRATRSSTGLLRWAFWEGMAGTDREALRFGWRLLWHSGLPRSRVRKQR